MGGFGIGSRISAEAQLAYSREFGNAIGVNWAGLIGYRALGVNYTNSGNNNGVNLVLHGPIIGVSVRF